MGLRGLEEQVRQEPKLSQMLLPSQAIDVLEFDECQTSDPGTLL
jgi:hypothetical protein